VLARGDEARARDILQQTMIKVARHIRMFEEEEVLWRWLTVLARTSAADEGRKASRYFAFLERFRIAREMAGAPPAGESLADDAVQDAIAGLELEDRQMLERKYFERWSVREIAEDLDTTEKAVESRLTRLRAKLKKALSQARHE
jgi:RNA polymerase sigma-70 factor (ECF subfamily)